MPFSTAHGLLAVKSWWSCQPGWPARPPRSSRYQGLLIRASSTAVVVQSVFGQGGSGDGGWLLGAAGDLERDAAAVEQAERQHLRCVAVGVGGEAHDRGLGAV